MDDAVGYRLDGDVAVVTIDDPATLNALTASRAGAIRAALDRAGGEARAVLLTGAGRAFCSGTSLAGQAVDANVDAGALLVSDYNPLMEALRACPVPLVTAVRGAAAGIGCSIALMGDIIVASETAYFLQAFAGIGLVADGGSAFLLTRAIGRTRAMELMLLGERLPAARALDWGLVNRVVADTALDEEALAMARRLAAGPAALAMIRRAGWAALELDFTEQLAAEARDQSAAGRTDDFREGIAAFAAKRPARFTGR